MVATKKARCENRETIRHIHSLLTRKCNSTKELKSTVGAAVDHFAERRGWDKDPTKELSFEDLCEYYCFRVVPSSLVESYTKNKETYVAVVSLLSGIQTRLEDLDTEANLPLLRSSELFAGILGGSDNPAVVEEIKGTLEEGSSDEDDELQQLLESAPQPKSGNGGSGYTATVVGSHHPSSSHHHHHHTTSGRARATSIARGAYLGGLTGVYENHKDAQQGILVGGGNGAASYQNQYWKEQRCKAILHDTSPSVPPSGDIAFVFSSVQSASVLWHEAPPVMRKAMNIYYTLMRTLMNQTGGYEVRCEGDSFFVAFQQPVQALQWCLRGQEELLLQEWPSELLIYGDTKPQLQPPNTILWRGLRARFGIGCGITSLSQNNLTGTAEYFGQPVNRAARVCEIARGGEIVASKAAMDRLCVSVEYKTKLEETLTVSNLGRRGMKGFRPSEDDVVFQILPVVLSERRFARGASEPLDVCLPNAPPPSSSTTEDTKKWSRKNSNPQSALLVSPATVEAVCCMITVENSKQLWQIDDVRIARSAHSIYCKLVRDSLAQFKGMEIRSEGSTFLCCFQYPFHAVKFALGLQCRLGQTHWHTNVLSLPNCRAVAYPKNVLAHSCPFTATCKPTHIWKGLRVKIALHFGRVQLNKDPSLGWDFTGAAVQKCLNLLALTHSGEILCSMKTFTHARVIARLLAKLRHATSQLTAAAVVVRHLGYRHVIGFHSPPQLVSILPSCLQDRQFEMCPKPAPVPLYISPPKLVERIEKHNDRRLSAYPNTKTADKKNRKDSKPPHMNEVNPALVPNAMNNNNGPSAPLLKTQRAQKDKKYYLEDSSSSDEADEEGRSKKVGGHPGIKAAQLLGLSFMRSRQQQQLAVLKAKRKEAPTGLIALVYTDVHEAPLIWHKIPSAMRFAMRQHHAFMRKLIDECNGYEVKVEGDSMLVAFAQATDAARFCIDAQLGLLHLDWPRELIEGMPAECGQSYDSTDGMPIQNGLRVKMGIHVGDCTRDHDPTTGKVDYYGPTVNRAVRVAGVARGSETLASQSAYKVLRTLISSTDGLRGRLHLVPMGMKKMKGFSGSDEDSVYQFQIEALAARLYPDPDKRDMVDFIPISTQPRPKDSSALPGPLEEATVVFCCVDHVVELFNFNAAQMTKAIAVYCEMVRSTLQKYSGYEVRGEGHMILCIFKSPTDALKFALHIQCALKHAEWGADILRSEYADVRPTPSATGGLAIAGLDSGLHALHIFDEDKCDINATCRGGTPQYKGLRVRIGIHTGKVLCSIVDTNTQYDIFGPAVNHCLSLVGVASGGQTLITPTVYLLVEHMATEKIAFGKVSTTVVKGGVVDSYSVLPFCCRYRQFASAEFRPIEMYVTPTPSDQAHVLQKLEEKERMITETKGFQETTFTSPLAKLAAVTSAYERERMLLEDRFLMPHTDQYDVLQRYQRMVNHLNKAQGSLLKMSLEPHTALVSRLRYHGLRGPFDDGSISISVASVAPLGVTVSNSNTISNGKNSTSGTFGKDKINLTKPQNRSTSNGNSKDQKHLSLSAKDDGPAPAIQRRGSTAASLMMSSSGKAIMGIGMNIGRVPHSPPLNPKDVRRQEKLKLLNMNACAELVLVHRKLKSFIKGLDDFFDDDVHNGPILAEANFIHYWLSECGVSMDGKSVADNKLAVFEPPRQKEIFYQHVSKVIQADQESLFAYDPKVLKKSCLGLLCKVFSHVLDFKDGGTKKKKGAGRRRLTTHAHGGGVTPSAAHSSHPPTGKKQQGNNDYTTGVPSGSTTSAMMRSPEPPSTPSHRSITPSVPTGFFAPSPPAYSAPFNYADQLLSTSGGQASPARSVASSAVAARSVESIPSKAYDRDRQYRKKRASPKNKGGKGNRRKQHIPQMQTFMPVTLPPLMDGST